MRNTYKYKKKKKKTTGYLSSTEYSVQSAYM